MIGIRQFDKDNKLIEIVYSTKKPNFELADSASCQEYDFEPRLPPIPYKDGVGFQQYTLFTGLYDADNKPINYGDVLETKRKSILQRRKIVYVVEYYYNDKPIANEVIGNKKSNWLIHSLKKIAKKSIVIGTDKLNPGEYKKYEGEKKWILLLSKETLLPMQNLKY